MSNLHKAVQNLLNDLGLLGFGTDEAIDGPNTIDAINQHWDELQAALLAPTTSIQHVQLDDWKHFLVVNGTRGPLTDSSTHPAFHPAGFIAFKPDGYGLPKHLQGKVFQVVTDPVEIIEDTACEPAQTAYKEYVEITKTCTEVKMSRFPEAGK